MENLIEYDDLTSPEEEDLIGEEDELTPHPLDDEFESLIDPHGAEAARIARKPDISYLEDAFEPGFDGTPLPRFAVGGKIIIERHSTLLPKRQWLNTQTYTVENIDYESYTLKLWNADLQQFDLTNWKSGILKHNFVYKLAPLYGSLKKKGRGRPKKEILKPDSPVQEVVSPEKKGRGRPKGSKNKPR